jgi:gliding-associated putative ABC transporter substrate-binding component GldG
MQKKRAEWIVFFLVLAVAVFLGLNTNRYFTRIDLTAGRQFTISKVSRELFREIPDQVYITYYVSEKLRRLYAFPAQVEDLLHEYAAYSRGRIKVSGADPAAGGQAGAVEELGVFPQQIEVIEQNERSVARVYTGIVIQYLDRHKSIPVVGRTDTLEYDLTSRIREVVQNRERILGVLVGNPNLDLSSNFEGLMARLSSDFSVRPLEKGQDIPDEISALFVAGGESLDRFDLFPVDQFIMKGGKAFFAVEGVHVDFQRNLAATPIENAPVLDMLEHYGIKVRRELVLDKYSKNFRQPRMVLGQVMWEIMAKYPHWITIADQFVSRDNPITARFAGLDLYWASPLELVERQGIKGEMIVQTTPDAWTMKEPFETFPDQGAGLAYSKPQDSGQQGVAAALSGTFSTFFSEIPTRQGEERGWKEIRKTSPETRILVVGDADFPTDLFQYTDASYNLDFVGNSAEWLSNDEDLLGIKTRVARDLRLNRIREPEARAWAALFIQVVNVALIPLAVIAFGVLRFFFRRKKRIDAAVEA